MPFHTPRPLPKHVERRPPPAPPVPPKKKKVPGRVVIMPAKGPGKPPVPKFVPTKKKIR